MSNSRLRLIAAEDKPSNSSKGKGLILETPYRPGFVDHKDLESVKMAVDKEFADISNAFYKTTEKTADTITRIDKIEIEGDGLLAKIEEVDRVSKEGDIALAERITTVSASVGNNTALIVEETRVRVDADSALAERITKLEADTGDDWKAAIEEEKRVRADADGALAERITTLKADMTTEDSKLSASIKQEESARVTADSALTSQINTAVSKLDGDIASVQQFATTEINKVDGKVNAINAKWGVSVNVNDKITGIQLNNDGKSSAFSVQADRFTFSDGSNTTSPPFEIVGGNTRIMSAFVNSIQSDNWNGSNVGWAITRDGWAKFNNVSVRGTIDAVNGTFENVRITGSCTYEGEITSDQVSDTAVTAVVKASNAINSSTGVGGATIDVEMARATVNNARAYIRTVQFTYPGSIKIFAQKGGSGTKNTICKMVMYYNGGVIGEAIHWNYNTNDTLNIFVSGVVVGNIPANTTGTVQVNAYLYFQDSAGMQMTATSQNSQFSIFKTSAEIT